MFSMFRVAAFGTIIFFCIGANAQGVPEHLQAAIFFKVLAYDYNIQTKAGNEVSIAVLIDSKTSGKKQPLQDGFNKLNGLDLNGKKIKVQVVQVSDSSLGDAASSDILYVPEGMDDKLIASVLKLAVDKKRATLGATESLAGKGCAIGLTVEDSKPKIVINLKASQSQGMKLSSKVLSLAKVIQ